MTSPIPPRSNGRNPQSWNRRPVPARVAERAFLRREVTQDGCWVSNYSVASHGYAQVGWRDKGSRTMVLAHRASWVHVNGQLPLGMTLDHTCKNRRCVNPDHLRLLPNFENARRTRGDDWPMGYCKNGHSNEHLEREYRRDKSGGKRYGVRCKLCNREWQRRHRARKAEKGKTA